MPVSPERRPVRGPQKTVRADWVTAALDILISSGVEDVTIQELSRKLDCARSSFYGYFSDRGELLDALLDHWRATNTQAIINQTNLPAPSINFALLNVFRCWSNSDLFDYRLDFAVREWARRSPSVRIAVDNSDEARISALTEMFLRFDFPQREATVRARIVYFTQIGYYTLDIRETMVERAQVVREYLYCHSGVAPGKAEIEEIAALTGHRPET